jgi:RNA polymerase sigma-70 factor, ECF subfamily
VDKNWERWLDNHGDRVFRLSLRLCAGCYADAEDLAQEALIAAFQSRPRFAGRAKVTTFLHAVTVNCWRKRLRAAPPQALPLLDTDSTPGNVIAAHLTRLSLDAAVAQLTEHQRAAFVLVKAEGLTHKEAAALLGVPQGTVQSRVHDAILRLRELLSEEDFR